MSKNLVALLFVSAKNHRQKMQIKKLEINNAKDIWVHFKNNSVGSYLQCFLRFYSQDDHLYYTILNNVFLSYLEQQITIRYNDKLVFFEQKLHNQTLSKKVAKKKYKHNLALIHYHQALKTLNFAQGERVKINAIKLKNFKIKAILDFGLVECNINDHEN